MLLLELTLKKNKETNNKKNTELTAFFYLVFLL